MHQASRQLGYTLEQARHAALIWREEADTPLATLESAAAALMRCTSSRQSLSVLAKPLVTKCAWYSKKTVPAGLECHLEYQKTWILLDSIGPQ